MNKVKHATLFGGGFNDTTTKEYSDTVEIGKLLAENGYRVKNGGYRGLMEAVSKGASEAGGEVIGFTCKTFKSTKGNEYLNRNFVADNIYDRLKLLIEDSDIFIIQKGGIGTLAEFFLVWDEFRKLKNTPKLILVGSHWRDIILSVSNLISVKESSKLTFVDNLDEIKNILENE